MAVGEVMGEYIALLIRSLPLLLKGAEMTVAVMVLAALLALLLGFFFGVPLSSRFQIPVVSRCLRGLTFVCRAVPFYVQLLVVYFVLPDLLGCNLDPFPAAVLSLGVCSSGYIAQIVRGGIEGIPAEQWEAAFALGYTGRGALYRIALPQMMRLMFPALYNELEALLKSTAVVSSIGLLELTRAGMNLVSRELAPVPLYLAVALFYLGLSTLFHSVAKQVERRLVYAHR